MIDVKVKGPPNPDFIVRQIAKILASGNEELRHIAIDAVDEYKDRLLAVKEETDRTNDPDDDELVALMGGFIDGILLSKGKDGEHRTYALHVPDEKLARLFEYGNPVVAAHPFIHSIKHKTRVQALAVFKEMERRIGIISRVASDQSR